MKKSALLLFPMLLLTACAGDRKPSVGMANPAAKLCVAHGGYLQPQTDAEGNQFALCHLPDGRVLEEWAYFREQQH